MFDIIALENCPYSKRAVKLLEDLAQCQPSIKVKVTWVNDTTKHNYNQTAGRQTFPQVSFEYKTSNGAKKSIYLGGCEDLERLVAVAQKLKSTYGAEVIAPLLQIIQC